MKGTRGQIVELLRQRGELSVAALRAALDIAAPALRRHLDILTAEGLVAHRAVKQPTGRPYFAYRLTEQAQEAAATGYARLLERLLQDAAAMPAGDGGRPLLDALLERMSEHLAEDYRSRVRGETLEERVRSLTEALGAEGILEDWESARTVSTCSPRPARTAAPRWPRTSCAAPSGGRSPGCWAKRWTRWAGWWTAIPAASTSSARKLPVRHFRLPRLGLHRRLKHAGDARTPGQSER